MNMNALKAAIIRILNASLPRRSKKTLIHLSFHLARSEFECFAHDFCLAPSMVRGLESMRTRGFLPRTIIDVGAYEGDWSIAAKRIWPGSQIFMVEPNLSKQHALKKIASDLNARLFDSLLGARNGETVKFNVMETGSSVMNERSAVQRTIETRNLVTLDSLEI